MLAFVRARLVDDWRVFLKKWSTWGKIVLAALNGLYAIWPSAADHVSFRTLAIVSVGLAVAIAALSLIKQPKLHPPKGN
jgi:hypothetical protein